MDVWSRGPLSSAMLRMHRGLGETMHRGNTTRKHREAGPAAMGNLRFPLDIYLSWTFPISLHTIFIPLTFITGIYGMNFQHMPELGWRWGYLGALGVMAAVGVSLLTYFKRKKWL